MTKNDGGPAFPTVNYEKPGNNLGTSIMTIVGGMTLRDYFAAHAPEKILWCFKIDTSDLGESPDIKALHDWQNKQRIYDKEVNKRRWIVWPYIWADAMLAERNK